MCSNKCLIPGSLSVRTRLIGVVESLWDTFVTLPLGCVDSGSAPSQFPLGEVQLTVRHSPQRNKLIVVVHACRSAHALAQGKTKIISQSFQQLKNS